MMSTDALIVFGVFLISVVAVMVTVSVVRHDRATCRVCQQRREAERLASVERAIARAKASDD
jgi:hypothetical protein